MELIKQPATVINLREYKGKEIIEVCESIIKQARAGKWDGFIYALREDSENHIVGAVGEYKKNPDEICMIAGSLFTEYNEASGMKIKNG